MKKLLAVIDMQKDFIDGSLGTKEAVAIVDKVKARIEQASANDEMVVFTKDTHTADYMNTQEGRKLPVKHCIKPEEGWMLDKVLQKFEDKYDVLEKPTFGSLKLAEMGKDYDEVTLIGLCTDICVISNAMLLKAYYPEMTVRVEADCCAGVTPASHNNALEAMKMCQIEVC